MNKKNLSVVMAGAMLATSVAPVLADTTTDSKVYEVTKGNAGLLIDKLDDLFATCPKFDETDRQFANKPVYTYQYRIAGTNSRFTPARYNGNKVDTSYIKTLASNANEYEIQVVNLGYRTDENGKVFSTKANTEVFDTYTLDELNALKTDFTKYSTTNTKPDGNGTSKNLAFEILSHGTEEQNVSGGNKVIKTFNVSKNTATLTLANNDTLTLKVGDLEKDFNKIISTDSSVKDAKDAVSSADKASKVKGFENSYKKAEVVGGDIENEVLYDVKLVSGDIKVEYKVTDLYDGFMMTDEGHKLLHELRDIDAKAESDSTKYGVTIENENAPILNNEFDITIKNNGEVKVITVKAVKGQEAKLETLKSWLIQRKANVDILAGSNRYATAVEIAKLFVQEQYIAKAPTTIPSGQTIEEVALNDLKNIVLVNGEALVDGLAAAPYAHALNTNGAPILLTADNKLPKETKAYLRELVGHYKVNNLPTIQIIGGEAVVSNTVVEELKDMGFKVKRVAGDNREETSLAVADKLREVKGNDYTKAFIVGAEGEADAMSIASHAAATETPIIVSKSTKGLSTVALNEASNYDALEIIGGEAAVSKSDEEKLVELTSDKAVTRLAGDNRFETNAKVIKAYHSDFDDVLVAKDGQKNKTDLVDALAVSMFASATTETSKAAPIVLATSKLSDSQLNQIVLKSKGTIDGTVYQVGYGVERSVMEKIVTKLGLDR